MLPAEAPVLALLTASSPASLPVPKFQTAPTPALGEVDELQELRIMAASLGGVLDRVVFPVSWSRRAQKSSRSSSASSELRNSSNVIRYSQGSAQEILRRSHLGAPRRVSRAVGSCLQSAVGL